MLEPVAFAEWGGRPADAASLAEAIRRTLDRLPRPAAATDDGWLDLHSSAPVPGAFEDLVRLIEQHRERNADGTNAPLAGYMLAFARGALQLRADTPLPCLSIRLRAGVAIGSPRLAANEISISANAGWLAATPHDTRIELLRTLVQVWRPSWAVLTDRPLMRTLRRLPDRTPWPGYASYHASSLAPAVVLPDGYEIEPFAAGTLTVMSEPWTADRAIEGIDFFLQACAYERIPDLEPA